MLDDDDHASTFESTKPREFTLWGYPVFATAQEWRSLNLRIIATELWREWNAVDYMVKHGSFNAEAGFDMCARLAELDRRMHRLVDAEITRMEASRR